MNFHLNLDLLTQDLDFSLSELRNADVLLSSLAEKHRLLIKQRGNRLVGVLFDPMAVREIAAKIASLEGRIKQLQAEIDVRDDEALEALVAGRLAGSRYVGGSEAAANEVRRLLEDENLLPNRS